MKEVFVFITFGKTPEELTGLSPYIFEIDKNDSSEEDLEIELLSFYKAFRERGVERVKYLILLATYREYVPSFFRLYRSIKGLHQKAITIPFEAEVFALLPSLTEKRPSKARTYQFFKTIEDFSLDNLPDIFWLIDEDRLSGSALGGDPPEGSHMIGDLIATYIATDVYRAFNSGLETKDMGYSSLGLARLVFPASMWQQYLSLKLSVDILSNPPLSPLEVTIEKIKAIFPVLSLLLRDDLSSLVEALYASAQFPSAEVILEGLVLDKEEHMERFFGRLMHQINQEKASRWAEIYSKAEAFCDMVKESLKTELDEFGLYPAWGFIGLLLGIEGPYINFLKNLDQWPEDLKGMDLNSFLYGWRGKEPSPVLNLLFNEVLEEMRRLYISRQIPIPSPVPSNWMEIFEELRRLLSNPEMEKVLGEEKGLMESLEERVKVIVEALNHPYRSIISHQDLEAILNWLEAGDREYLTKMLKEVNSCKKKFEEMEQKWHSLGWKRCLPLSLNRWVQLQDQEKGLEGSKDSLRQAFSSIVDRRRRLFACYFAPFAGEKLKDLLYNQLEEIRDFIEQRERWFHVAHEGMEDMDFGLPYFAHQVVEGKEDIKKLYHHPFPPQEIPHLLEEFLRQSQERGEPYKLSSFAHTKEMRKAFYEGLHAFCLSKFSWLLDWDIVDAIRFLAKEELMASLLADKTSAFLQIKDSGHEEIAQALFIGLKEVTRNPFPSSSFALPSPIFYSHGRKDCIIGLRLLHGFPLSCVEGWEYWKECAQE